MRRLALLVVMGLPCAALWLVGPVALGHVLFAMGDRAAAARWLGDAAWSGYALASTGRWEDAAAAFGGAPANAFNRGNALAHAHRYHEAIDAYDDALDANPEDEDARFNKEIVRKILAEGGVDAGSSASQANASATKEHRGKASDMRDGETSSSGNGYVGNQEGASVSGTQGGSKVSRAGRGDKTANDSGQGKATGSASQGNGIGRSGGDLADIAAMATENHLRAVRGHTDQGVIPSLDWLKTLPDDPGAYLKLRILAEQKRRAARSATPDGDDD